MKLRDELKLVDKLEDVVIIGGLKSAGVGAWSFSGSTVMLLLQLRLGALTSLHVLVNCHRVPREKKYFLFLRD